MHKSSLKDVYELMVAENPLPLVFDSPHSGTRYPKDFAPVCDPHILMKAEDRFVDDLFSAAPDVGACLLSALFPRSYLDVNRAADDIDPEILSAPWPQDDPAYGAINPSNRSYAGIGLIRRLVKPGEPVYDRQLAPAEVKARIDTYYRPYHATLEKLIEGAHYNFGQVWHVNCHSMPSFGASQGFAAKPDGALAGPSGLAEKHAMTRINPFPSPDFVLGDRDGTSCDIDFTHSLREFLRAKGYKVAINDPYKGVELVQRYSSPATGRHSIQIEICRSLYLNEETYEKNKNYDRLKADMSDLVTFLADYVQSNLIQLAAD